MQFFGTDFWHFKNLSIWNVLRFGRHEEDCFEVDRYYFRNLEKKIDSLLKRIELLEMASDYMPGSPLLSELKKHFDESRSNFGTDREIVRDSTCDEEKDKELGIDSEEPTISNP